MPEGALTPLSREIIAVVAMLAPGEVVSYGDVAHDAGHPGASRAVGAVLAATGLDVPWWRVVRSDGRLVTAQRSRQASLLRSEGVVVRNQRVVNAPAGRFARGQPRSKGTAEIYR
jgi:methylated-DNA-protein-cysteine methyltransferase-like protein